MSIVAGTVALVAMLESLSIEPPLTIAFISIAWMCVYDKSLTPIATMCAYAPRYGCKSDAGSPLLVMAMSIGLSTPAFNSSVLKRTRYGPTLATVVGENDSDRVCGVVASIGTSNRNTE